MSRLNLSTLSVGRALGLRCDPIPGESFPSYAERLCSCQPRSAKVSVKLLLARAGLVQAEHHKAQLPGYGVVLSPDHLEKFARVTGNSEEVIGATLLTHYAGVCLTLPDVDPADPDFARALAHSNWVYGAGTHVGPCCLATPWVDPTEEAEHDGLQRAWMLRWKLPWSFLCPVHGHFLLGECPRCHQRPGNHRVDLGAMPRFASSPPRPGVCMNARAPGERGAGRDSLPCLYDLAKAPMIPVTQARLLETQATLDRLLAGQPLEIDGREVLPLEAFGHLRSLVSLIRHVAQPGDLGLLQAEVEAAFVADASRRDETRAEKTPGRKGTSVHPYKAAPTDPLLMAATLPLALDILTAPDRAARVDRIGGLVDRAREVKRKHAWQLADYFHLEGPVLEAYGVHLTANAQTPRRLGRHAHDRQTYRFTPDHVPAQLWPEVFQEHFAHFFEGSSLLESSARRFVSMSLVLLTGPLTRADAARALGLPSTHVNGVYNKAMGVVRGGGHLEAFDATLKACAEAYSAHPARVDYGRRRRALATFTEVPQAAWQRVDPRVGVRTEGRRRSAAAWIWAYLTLGDAEHSPALTSGIQHPSSMEMYRQFVRWAEPERRPALERLAADVLVQAMQEADRQEAAANSETR